MQTLVVFTPAADAVRQRLDPASRQCVVAALRARQRAVPVGKDGVCQVSCGNAHVTYRQLADTTIQVVRIEIREWQPLAALNASMEAQ